MHPFLLPDPSQVIEISANMLFYFRNCKYEFAWSAKFPRPRSRPRSKVWKELELRFRRRKKPENSGFGILGLFFFSYVFFLLFFYFFILPVLLWSLKINLPVYYLAYSLKWILRSSSCVFFCFSSNCQITNDALYFLHHSHFYFKS